jgi:hypothetical protein
MKRNEITITMTKKQLKLVVLTMGIALDTDCRPMNEMSDEQLNMIAPAFDVPYWIRKFKEVPGDVALVKEICEEVGIR